MSCCHSGVFSSNNLGVCLIIITMLFDLTLFQNAALCFLLISVLSSDNWHLYSVAIIDLLTQFSANVELSAKAWL